VDRQKATGSVLRGCVLSSRGAGTRVLCSRRKYHSRRVLYRRARAHLGALLFHGRLLKTGLVKDAAARSAESTDNSQQSGTDAARSSTPVCAHASGGGPSPGAATTRRFLRRDECRRWAQEHEWRQRKCALRRILILAPFVLRHHLLPPSEKRFHIPSCGAVL
jgi:hypothetical protein